MKDFLSIKEFSKLSGIAATTLRYWDEIGLFTPAKRNEETNYRYYSPEQVIAVNFITVLSSLSIPLKTVGEMTVERTPDKIIRLIERQEKFLDMEMRRLRERYSVIHTRLELINYGKRVLNGFRVVDGLRQEDGAENGNPVNVKEVAVLWRDDLEIILGPRNEFRDSGSFYEPFIHFCQQAEDLRIHLNFPIGGYHENMDSFMKAPGQPDYFFSMDPTGNRKRTAGYYLTGFSHGYYGEFGDLHERIRAYAEEHSLTVTGPVYTIYLHDEISTSDVSQYLAQICVEVTGKSLRKRDPSIAE